MTDEKENSSETTTNEAEVKKTGKSSLMKYIMIGGGAFVLAVVIAVAAMMFFGGDTPHEAEVEDQPTQHDETPSEESDGEFTSDDMYDDDEPPAFYDEDEFMNDADEPGVLDNITDNLAFLDYQPDESVITAEEETIGMSVEDSMDAARWLEGEKAALALREKELAARENELKILDKKVSQKLLTLDQARTNRVSSLAKLYDGMDSRSVAALMANLDDATVVSILPRMKTKNASQVLALFPPKRGAKLSKQMITIAEK